MLANLQGYKTYIVCAATIAYAVIGMALGFLDANSGMQMILTALGGISLRHAISTTLPQ
jgi:hypothetical protein